MTLNSQIEKAIREAVQRCFNTNWRVYAGEQSERLQSELQSWTGKSNVQLTCSGTAALEVALRAAGVGVGDEVILSGYDYPGNFWAIERIGARPVLIDVEPSSWAIDFKPSRSTIIPSTKAIVVSHLHGQLQSTKELRRWCTENSVILIEDCCQCIGAQSSGRPVGAESDISIYSFGGSKVLSAGRGGALATNDATLAQRAKIAAGVGSGAYDLSELQAAVVLAQLPFLHALNDCCRAIFAELDTQLNGLGWHSPALNQSQCNEVRNAFYQAGWLVAQAKRDEAIAALQKVGIPAGVGFSGFHRRSNRRCRVLSNLDQTASVAQRTLVIHYSYALQPVDSTTLKSCLEQLADESSHEST